MEETLLSAAAVSVSKQIRQENHLKENRQNEWLPGPDSNQRPTG
jgi:hypothetical protein